MPTVKKRVAVRRRKQSIKFRPKYAGRMAKDWGQRAVRTLFATAVAAGVLGGGLAARRAWSNSDAFKIRDVILQGDIPTELGTKLPFDPAGNILALRPGRIRRVILTAFPELQSVSVRRTWSRHVVVTGRYRKPLAWFSKNGAPRFIDSTGTMFGLPPDAIDRARLPELGWTRDADRVGLLQCLTYWSSHWPRFSSQITTCETDTIHEMHVTLADGSVVDWGAIDADALDARTRHVMSLMENYHPAKTPAHLLFVTNDRLVMDSHWAQATLTQGGK